MGVIDQMKIKALSKQLGVTESTIKDLINAVASKVDGVGTKVDNKSAGLTSCVKSVQRGVVRRKSGSNTYEKVTISPVDLSKSLFLVTGCGGYDTLSYTSTVFITEYDSTYFKVSYAFSIDYGDSYATVNKLGFSWQVIEFN